MSATKHMPSAWLNRLHGPHTTARVADGPGREQEWTFTRDELEEVLTAYLRDSGQPDLLEACKAARPLLVSALAFVDCKPQLAALDAAIAKAQNNVKAEERD